MNHRTRNHWWCWLYLLMLVAVLCGVGCGSLVSFRRKAPPPAPEPVTPSIRQMELEVAIARWVEDALGVLECEGAEPHAPVIIEARRGTRAVRTRLGEPGVPLPVPDSSTIVPVSVTAAIDDLERENVRLRRELARWWAGYEAYRGTPVTTGWSLGSGWLNWSMLLGGGGLLIALLVKVAIGLKLGPLAALGKTIIGVLQGVKDDEPMAWDEVVGPRLEVEMDRAEKMLVDKVLVKNGGG